MKKLLKFTLAIAFAIGLASCADDVTVRTGRTYGYYQDYPYYYQPYYYHPYYGTSTRIIIRKHHHHHH